MAIVYIITMFVGEPPTVTSYSDVDKSFFNLQCQAGRKNGKGRFAWSDGSMYEAGFGAGWAVSWIFCPG